jgi:hypothetical protein
MSDVNSEVNCKWLSEYSVSCIIPPLYRTGREMVQLRVVLSDNETLTFTGIITIGMIYGGFPWSNCQRALKILGFVNYELMCYIAKISS